MAKPKKIDERDAEIKALKRELRDAREDVIDLCPAPDGLKEMLRLRSTYGHQTPEEEGAWEAKVVDAVVASAKPDPPSATYALLDRVACPLCGGKGHGSYDIGFKWPTGLKYHLTGSMAARHCRVTAAAFEGALQDRFDRDERSKVV
jgi:hypothetical protein